MRITRKLIALLLAAAILALAGCGSATSWVYEKDGERLAAGVYINFLMAAISEIQMEDYQLNGAVEGYTQPTVKDLLRTPSPEGGTVSDKVRQRASEMAAEYYALNAKLAEMNIQLSAEDASYIDSYVEYLWTSASDQTGVTGGKAMFEDNGISQASARLFQGYLIKKENLFTALYAEGGEKAPPEEELKSEFLNRYDKVEMMQINANSDADELDEAKKARADEIFAEYKGGAAIEELDYKYKQETAEDPATVTKGEEGANNQFMAILNLTEEQIIQNAVAKAAIGEPTMVESNNVFTIFTRLDPEDGYADYRATIVYDLKYAEYEQYLKELANAVQLTVNQAAIDRYTPEKIRVEA
jgi:hypothetical protein